MAVEPPIALSNWLLQWMAEAGDEAKEMMIHGVYGLWLARNEARDGERIADARNVAESVFRLVQEWKLVHEKIPKTPSSALAERWTAPEEGWLKVNSDGATSKHNERAGGGVVARDHIGAFRGGACFVFRGFPTQNSPSPAEKLSSWRCSWKHKGCMWKLTTRGWSICSMGKRRT